MSGYSIASATTSDAPDVDAGLIISKGAVWIAGLVKDLDGVDCLRQILTRMPGATGDRHVKCLVCGPLRDDDTCLKCVIEDDSIGEIPGQTSKTRRTAHTGLFLHSEDNN